MAMRRSRIKLKPNLGVKVRGPAAPSTSRPVAGEVTKQEPDEEDGVSVIKPRVAEDLEDSSGVIITKSEPVEKKRCAITAINHNVPCPDVEKSAPMVQHPDEGTHMLKDPCQFAVNPDATMGPIVPALALVGISKITPVSRKDEHSENKRTASESESDGGETVKPFPGTRVRNRFPKARPNLTVEAAIRGRIRTNSMSGQSDDESMRSPPALHRLPGSWPRQTSVSEASPSPQLSATGVDNTSPPAPPEPSKPEVVRVPNNNNSLGIDMGCAIVKRVIKYERDEDGNRKKPKKMEWIKGPIDKSKITMRDLIHMNPITNPMKSSLADKERHRQQREMKREKGEDKIDTVSMVSTATLQEERDMEILEDEVGTGEDGLEGGAAPPTKPDPEEEELTAVPQVRIGQNGEIILNESSLFIDNKDPEADSKAAAMELVHETDFSASSFSYGRKTVSRLWTEMETKKFYLALSAVGTDFSLMGNLFPKRTRTELKRKFKREEKSNRYLVDKAIREQQHFNQEFFDNLRALQIDEPVSKKQQRKCKSQDENEEDQENQSGSEEKKKKKNTVKVEKKEGDGTEKVKKKRGRPPKVKVTEAAGVNEDDTISKPKRKMCKKAKSLEYVESDSDSEDKEANPEPGCSREAEEPNVTKVKRGRKTKAQKVEGEEAPKPKRQRKQKAKGDEDTSTIDPQTDIPAVSEVGPVVESTPLVEHEEAPDALNEASYVFVASSPCLDGNSGATEPVIHVYLVSPTGGEMRQPPDTLADLGRVMHHPTPSLMRSPPAIPFPASFLEPISNVNALCLSDYDNQEMTRGSGEPVSVDVRDDERHPAEYPTEEYFDHLLEAGRANCIPERDQEEPVSVSVEKLHEPAKLILDHEDNNTTATVGQSILSESISHTAQMTTEDDYKSYQGVIESNCEQTEDVPEPQRAWTTTVVAETPSESPEGNKVVSMADCGVNAPWVSPSLEGDRVDETPRVSTPGPVGNTALRVNTPGDGSGDKALVVNTRKPGDDKTPGLTAPGGAGVKGRRRRITAMPKIPAGRRKPAKATPQLEPHVTKPTPPTANATEETQPIDILMAGGILLEMSNTE